MELESGVGTTPEAKMEVTFPSGDSRHCNSFEIELNGGDRYVVTVENDELVLIEVQ